MIFAVYVGSNYSKWVVATFFCKQLLYVGRNHRYFLSNLEDDPSTPPKKERNSKTKKNIPIWQESACLSGWARKTWMWNNMGRWGKKNDRNQVQIQDKSRYQMASLSENFKVLP